MEPFATPADYRARYDTDMSDERLGVLLGDASAFIASFPGFSYDSEDAAQAQNLKMVTCSVVNRSIPADGLAGLQSYSESAVGISASATPYNPSGDFWLTKSEKRVLGITGTQVGAIRPAIHAPDGEVVW